MDFWREQHEFVIGDQGVTYDVYADGRVRAFIHGVHTQPVETRISQIRGRFPDLPPHDLRRMQDVIDKLRNSRRR